jgi:hypothetical protein
VKIGYSDLLRATCSYVLVALLASFITFQLTRPSLAQVPMGQLHVAATDCAPQPTTFSGGDFSTGFSAGRVVSYIGTLDCGRNSLVRYVVLYQN